MEDQPHTGNRERDAPSVLRFGDVVVDRGRRVVSRNGTRQSLPETYLNAIFLLIDKQPATVGKGELAGVLKIADDSIPKAMELIRRALGEI